VCGDELVQLKYPPTILPQMYSHHAMPLCRRIAMQAVAQTARTTAMTQSDKGRPRQGGEWAHRPGGCSGRIPPLARTALCGCGRGAGIGHTTLAAVAVAFCPRRWCPQFNDCVNKACTGPNFAGPNLRTPHRATEAGMA